MFIDLSDSPPRTSDIKRDVPTTKDKGHLHEESVRKVVDERKISSVSPWQPFYLNLLRQEAISPAAVENNRSCCLSLDDIISSTNDDITNVAILTFDVDAEWLLETVPILINAPLLVLHNGLKKNDTVQLENVVLSPVDMGMERYGTHHNKIIFVFYKTGLRVAITTANFTEVDWTLKIQGTYVQDFPRKPSSRSSSEFECSLISHCERISPMGTSAQQEWKKIQQQIQQYDFNSAEVVLISSVPGRHKGPNRNKWGQWKLREEILMSKPEGIMQDYDQRLLMQFSSIGALKSNEAFIDELISSLGAIDPNALQTSQLGKKQKTSKNTASLETVESQISKQRVELVWPTVDAVRGSIQGWAAGFSIPCESKVQGSYLLLIMPSLCLPCISHSSLDMNIYYCEKSLISTSHLRALFHFALYPLDFILYLFVFQF
jgi:Tyrosyl-DNA phosphodiesterase